MTDIKTYTPAEAATLLRVSEGSVWKWWRRWGLKPVETDGKVLFTEPELIALIWRYRCAATGETACAPVPAELPVLLVTAETAGRLRHSVRSLQLHRHAWGLRPIYLLPRRPLYVESDVVAFLLGHPEAHA
jgi:hypothetical protein